MLNIFFDVLGEEGYVFSYGITNQQLTENNVIITSVGVC